MVHNYVLSHQPQPVAPQVSCIELGKEAGLGLLPPSLPPSLPLSLFPSLPPSLPHMEQHSHYYAGKLYWDVVVLCMYVQIVHPDEGEVLPHQRHIHHHHLQVCVGECNVTGRSDVAERREVAVLLERLQLVELIDGVSVEEEDATCRYQVYRQDDVGLEGGS